MTDARSITSFLDEAFLEKLEQLRLIAQRRVRGGTIGEHTSWRHGENLEFLDYRNYYPGDDVRYVDWNVYGRLDKLFIKLFQSEKDFAIHILIDTSRSMAIGSPAKDIQARKIAAALSYIGLANHDRIGITAFNRTITTSRFPEKGRRVYLSILNFLQEIEPAGRTDLVQSLATFLATPKQAGLIILISDLLDPTGLKSSLQSLNMKKFDPVVIQVLDESEINPPAGGYLKLTDVETGEHRTVMVTGTIRNRYREKIQQMIKHIADDCFESDIEYFLAKTEVPFEDFLLHFLINGRFLK